MEPSKTILGKSMLFTRVPLVYAGDHNGTLVDVYGYNGHPRVVQCLTHAFDINFHDSIDFCASPLIKRDLT